ncbi:MAG: pyrroline-5-carboxylate reductase, partial [Sphingorhabdus sp.]
MLDLSPHSPLLFFGCGNMGRAILEGWLRGGIDPASFIIVDPGDTSYPEGIRHFIDIAALPKPVDKAVIAVKPQVFPKLSMQLEAALQKDTLVLSVMAGVRLNQLATALPGRRLVRLMPNLAAAVGKSPLGLFTHAVERQQVETMLAPLGAAIWIDDEDLMDAVTALAGSGPAFVYRFIDALAKAGEALGLPPDISARLALAMIDGAADLAAASDTSPAELAKCVTSPGGTTAAGLAVLDRDETLNRLVAATLQAA